MKFFPASVHGQAWMNALLVAGGMTAAQATATGNLTLTRSCRRRPPAATWVATRTWLRKSATVVRSPVAQKQIGGDTATFTPTGVHGKWLAYPGAIDPRLQARRPADAAYLFPIYRGLNPGTKGVISVTGTVGISGVLRGKMTLYATGNVVILDDQRYATDPSLGTCADMLGMISANNITVADNALNDPPNVGAYRNEDDTQDVFIHGVMMAINTSFGVENYDQGPNNANDCEGTNSGRGCLYLNGGIIQQRRGAVGLTSGEGFIKRYSYDRCAVSNPPPYFPTTGRYLDNRYYEIDPVRFNIAALFAGLTPN